MADRTVTGSQTSLREANRALILEVVKRFGAITQVELADATGLSAGTVSIIVKELAEAGLIATSATSRNGRRAIQVTLARHLGLVAGVHFSRRFLRVALADPTGEIVAEQHLPLAKDHRADTGLDRAALFIADMLERVGASRDELRSVGVAVSAPLDKTTGAVCSPGLMRGWDQVPIAAEFAGRVRAPVVVDNDANLGVLAECRYGAGVGHDPVVYLPISHGIGSGLFVDGHVLRGFSGIAGELGHVSIDADGSICYCGNRGCLETLAGSAAILESLRATHGNLALRDLITQALAGDIACRRVIADAAHHIGVALAGLCNVVDPERIVVGGELAEVGDLLLGPLRQVTARFTLPGTTSTIEIVPAALGGRSEILGAIAFALDAVPVPTIPAQPPSSPNPPREVS